MRRLYETQTRLSSPRCLKIRYASLCSSGYDPIGFALGLLRGCVHTSLRGEVVASGLVLHSNVNASALILLVLG